MAVSPRISIGCESIDKILEGGLPPRSISLVYGEAETGKTTLAMQCAVNCARHGLKTLFVDCDGTFSARRLSQIASEMFKEIAGLIILMKPNDFREQTAIIDHLSGYITNNFGLVVFDTLTSLYSVKVAETSGKAYELNRELNRQMALLAQNAKTQKVAMLVTGQVRSVFNNEYVSVEPVATRVLKFWADIIIAMKPSENSGIISATLEKTPRKTGKAQSLTFNLRIDKTGIHEYSVH